MFVQENLLSQFADDTGAYLKYDPLATETT